MTPWHLITQDPTMTDPALDGLARLSQLADQQHEAELLVADLKLALLDAQAEIDRLAEIAIPELMEEIGMAEFKTSTGLKITVTDKIRCGQLTKADGLQWLRDNGQAGLIKSQVVVPFTRGEDSAAQKFVDRLAGDGMAATHEAFVPWNSLAAAVKSMMADGEEVPMKTLGAYEQRRAKVETK